MELDGSDSSQSNNNNGKTQQESKPGEKVATGMAANKIIGPYSPKEKFQNLLNLFVLAPSAGKRIKKMNGYIKQAIEDVKPDLIWFDNTYLAPAIYYSGIPWINSISTTPLYMTFDETLQVPPGGSGNLKITR